MSPIMEGLELSGIDEKNISPEQLDPVDQFHRGIKAVQFLLSNVDNKRDHRVLTLIVALG